MFEISKCFIIKIKKKTESRNAKTKMKKIA